MAGEGGRNAATAWHRRRALEASVGAAVEEDPTQSIMLGDGARRGWDYKTSRSRCLKDLTQIDNGFKSSHFYAKTIVSIVSKLANGYRVVNGMVAIGIGLEGMVASNRNG